MVAQLSKISIFKYPKQKLFNLLPKLEAGVVNIIKILKLIPWNCWARESLLRVCWVSRYKTILHAGPAPGDGLHYNLSNDVMVLGKDWTVMRRKYLFVMQIVWWLTHLGRPNTEHWTLPQSQIQTVHTSHWTLALAICLYRQTTMVYHYNWGKVNYDII